MADYSDMFSLVAIIFSAISMLFIFMKYGMSLTLEFSESVDVQDRRQKIESQFRSELAMKMAALIEQYAGSETIDAEAVIAIQTLGQDAIVCTLPSKIINEVSSYTSGIMSHFFGIVLSIAAFAFSYWIGINEVPFLTSYQRGIIAFVTIALF